MNSDGNATQTSKNAGRNISAAPSIVLLNRRLGTSPALRMLTPSEVALLRQCAKEASEIAGEVLANEGGTSET